MSGVNSNYFIQPQAKDNTNGTFKSAVFCYNKYTGDRSIYYFYSRRAGAKNPESEQKRRNQGGNAGIRTGSTEIRAETPEAKGKRQGKGGKKR
ncbi:hypothetical protein BRYFOR_07319 [Marvinbryantia formatexigens DSM 14469]|uniref:Uncharacterized protein n=1 Tax=Marvinbryantia formatexigens DSM 14469 TaxID=478749 RepID=C6LFB7_9FIRM|nr:hypothetical protein BRYFOR_07319 [Marvinbryantia formatexigens DSM 14469]SDH20846.1 hypothetical protein SAMN05660368_04020 [Marvinbryantia formatexigens]